MKTLYFKKVVVGLLLLVLIAGIPMSAIGESANRNDIKRYSKTRDIYAYLSISGGTATCYGYVRPNNVNDCSITVTLYKKNGTAWIGIASWNDSVIDGNIASVYQTESVNHGTYKVVAVGNVDGEYSRAESSINTY